MLYRTIDWYEGKEIIYKGESLNDAKKARKERYEDTDDEADVTIEELISDAEGHRFWRSTSY